mmetsp:Transcript_17460/g.52221  ORF Transcript_17460/g.52221 Transcript_17460/m.52221 type:complete len:211 (+) Transcript_17460:958-1590(+)
MGAYLWERSEEEVEQALKLLNEKPAQIEVPSDKKRIKPEYLDTESPDRVLAAFGQPTHAPSLGVPTFHYGHEPSNRFATWVAKFFQNSLRENDLLEVCTGGVVFTPGSAGTRQEVFQACCSNHYGDDPVPFVFLDRHFWLEQSGGVYELVQKTSEGRPYHDMLMCTDSVQELVAHMYDIAKRKQRPLITDPKTLLEAHWEGGVSLGECDE